MARIAFEIAEVVYGSMGMYRFTSSLLPDLLDVADGAHQFLLYSATPRRVDRRRLDIIPDQPFTTLKMLPYPPRLFEGWRHFRPLVSLESLIGKVDLVHTQASTLQPPCRSAGLLMTIHGISPLRTPEHYSEFILKGYRQKMRDILLAADFIVALTGDNRRSMVELLDVPPECIRVIPSAVGDEFCPGDPGKVAAELVAYKLIPASYILYVGSLGAHKNIRMLLASFARLPSVLRAHYELVLAGPGDPYALGWAQMAHDLGITPRVRWLGHLPPAEIPAFMQGARLFLFPSFCEGFALPPLEAMACGTPVIVSNASSLPETVGPGGIHVTPDSPEDWAAAIERVLTDPTVHRELSQRALSQASQFNWRATAKATLELYGELLSGGLDTARAIWPKRHRKPWGGSH